MKKIFLLALAIIAGSAISTHASTPVDHSKTYTYRVDTVYCQREGLKIFGLAYIPEAQTASQAKASNQATSATKTTKRHRKAKTQQWPLVIYAHGIGSSHAAGEPYAKALAHKGYAVYTFDFCGSTTRSKSDGNVDDMTIFTEQKDLTAIIGTLKQMPYVDASRTYLLGISLGGLVSSITAASMPDAIRNLALVYPALCAPDDARKTFDADGNRRDPNGRIMGGENYNKAMLQFDPFDCIGQYSKPVFIVHGTKDMLVPIAYSERAITVFPDARLEKIEGAGHGFRGEPLEKAIKLIGAQLDEWERVK